MPSRKQFGRIWFRGNPWPKGHAITSFIWSARVERGTGVWFDLHLTTANYWDGDPSSGPNYCDESDTKSEWKSKANWCNFHSCTISSTEWVGNGYGFLAGTKDEPLDFSRIGRRTFAFDDDPDDVVLHRPFAIYLTGHDSISGHRIKFKRESKKRTFSVNWKGEIALSYSGSDNFDYSFEAKIVGASFNGIEFANDVSDYDARVLAEPFLANPHEGWRIKKSKSGIRLVPK